MYSMLKRCPELLAWEKLGKRIALDVALGLNHLHSRRPAFQHRDLKSPNVLLTREGTAKIADVGMMRTQVQLHCELVHFIIEALDRNLPAIHLCMIRGMCMCQHTPCWGVGGTCMYQSTTC